MKGVDEGLYPYEADTWPMDCTPLPGRASLGQHPANASSPPPPQACGCSATSATRGCTPPAWDCAAPRPARLCAGPASARRRRRRCSRTAAPRSWSAPRPSCTSGETGGRRAKGQWDGLLKGVSCAFGVEAEAPDQLQINGLPSSARSSAHACIAFKDRRSQSVVAPRCVRPPPALPAGATRSCDTPSRAP